VGDTWVTDITDFEDLPPDITEGPAHRIAVYFGSIVSAASALPTGVWVDAAIQCRRRPGRKKCPGHIQLYRASALSSIEWHCSFCDDQGVITNWKGTRWDLSRWCRSTEPKLRELLLTHEELRELRNNLTFDPECECLIWGTILTPNGIVMRATDEGLDDLLGFIAAESNHEERKHRRNILDRVYDKIDAILDEQLGENASLADWGENEIPQLSSGIQRFLDELEKHFREDQNHDA